MKMHSDLVNIEDKEEAGEKTYGVPSLHEHSTGSGELAHQSFTSRQSRDDTARSYTLKNILRVPGDQVAIVHNISLSIRKLRLVSVKDRPQTLHKG